MFGFLGKIGSAMKGAGKGAAMGKGAAKPTGQLSRLARTGANMGASFLGNQSRAKYPTPLGQQPQQQQPGISGPEMGGPPIQDARYRGPGQSQWQNPGLGFGMGGRFGMGGGGDLGGGRFGGTGMGGGSFDQQWGHPRIIDSSQLPDFLRGDQQMMGGGGGAQDMGMGPSAELRRRFGLG